VIGCASRRVATHFCVEAKRSVIVLIANSLHQILGYLLKHQDPIAVAESTATAEFADSKNINNKNNSNSKSSNVVTPPTNKPAKSLILGSNNTGT